MAVACLFTTARDEPCLWGYSYQPPVGDISRPLFSRVSVGHGVSKQLLTSLLGYPVK